MPDFDYEQWWSLHLRVARGERLSAQEEQAYQMGLSYLDSQTETVEVDTILEQQIHELHETIAAQERYITALQALLESVE